MADCACPTCGQGLPADLMAIDYDAGIVGGDAGANLSKALVEIYNKGLQTNQIQIGAKSR